MPMASPKHFAKYREMQSTPAEVGLLRRRGGSTSVVAKLPSFELGLRPTPRCEPTTAPYRPPIKLPQRITLLTWRGHTDRGHVLAAPGPITVLQSATKTDGRVNGDPQYPGSTLLHAPA